MTLVITHSQVAGTGVDTDAIVDGADWDANHTLTGVVSASQGGTGIVNNDSSTLTISGAFGTTFTVTATTSVTLPTTGTLATLAGSEALTNKTYNGNTWTAGTGTLTIAAGKTLTASNTLTFTGTDASSVAFGTGGTVLYSGGALGTPSSGTLTNCTGLPISTGLTGTGTGVLTALAINVGSAGAFVTFNGALGTPSSGTLTNATGLPISTGVSGLGTGIATALGINTGSAGAPVLFNGALGTPSSGTLTNATGLPVSTGISGLGTGVADFLATPSSANLASAVTGETGSGALVFGTGPTIDGPTIDGATITGVIDAGGASSFELPNDTAPTVNANGEIAVDTSVTDFSHGIIKYYSGEELGVVAMPVAQFTTPTNGAVPTYNSTNDEFEMVVPGGSGTVTSVVGNGVTITSTGTIPPPYGLVNHSLAVSAAASALTIALKDFAGSDPSAASPVNGYFRNVTATTGSATQLTVTGALSLVVSSGSTLGVTSSTAFRLWVVLFNDGGTARLGVINCATSSSIFPLADDTIASSTAEGGAGAADSAGVFYTGTAVTSKAYLIVGYVEWNASGVTAGTWTTTNVAKVQSFGPGIKKPGEVVQEKISATGAVSTGTTVIPEDDTIPQNTEGDEYFSLAITPTSAANSIELETAMFGCLSKQEALVGAFFQDSTANALATGFQLCNGANFPFFLHFSYQKIAGTSSSTTFKVRAGPATAATFTFNGQATARLFGGTFNSYFKIQERMT